MPHLSVAGFGAELLGLFDNGMVQSFINARTLSAIGNHFSIHDFEVMRFLSCAYVVNFSLTVQFT